MTVYHNVDILVSFEISSDIYFLDILNDRHTFCGFTGPMGTLTWP